MVQKSAPTSDRIIVVMSLYGRKKPHKVRFIVMFTKEQKERWRSLPRYLTVPRSNIGPYSDMILAPMLCQPKYNLQAPS